MTNDAPMKRCPDCGGQGGWEEDRWCHNSGHYTEGRRCDTCEGTGEVPARCDCGGPAEHRNEATPGDWLCTECKAAGDPDRIPTAPDGVPVTMAELVRGAA